MAIYDRHSRESVRLRRTVWTPAFAGVTDVTGLTTNYTRCPMAVNHVSTASDVDSMIMSSLENLRIRFKFSPAP